MRFLQITQLYKEIEKEWQHILLTNAPEVGEKKIIGMDRYQVNLSICEQNLVFFGIVGYTCNEIVFMFNVLPVY